ncbi:MAG: hypothetical protein J1D77_02470 [Muribaculaceae bacterium]|nr:hypothetical protein [Muribaculaceae bacterium]
MRNFAMKLIAGAFLLGSASVAQGAEIGVDLTNDLGAITPGVTYNLAQEGDYFTFKPVQSGPITIQTNFTGKQTGLMNLQNQTCFFMFSEYADIFLQMVVNYAENVEGQGWSFIFNVEANKNYVIGYNDLLRGAGPIEFTLTVGDIQAVPSTLNYCYPTPGSSIDLASGFDYLVVGFDQTVTKIAGANLSYTDKMGQPQYISIPSGVNGYSIDVDPYRLRIDNFTQFYSEAKKDADYDFPFYINFENIECGAGPVTSVNLKEGGEFITIGSGSNVSIEYNFIDNVRLLDAVIPNPFYAFWPEGTAAGMAVMTFDSPINMKEAEISLVMGHHIPGASGTRADDDPDPFFSPSYSLNDDNTVLTIDFTGVSYDERLQKTYEEVSLIITGIYGENGLLAIMGGGTEENPAVDNYFLRFIPYVNEAYDPAGIENILAEGESIKGVYNIQGIKVDPDKIQKGIYIVNGKKVMVK